MYVRPYTLFSTLHPVLLIIYALGAPVLAMLSKAPGGLLIAVLGAFVIHWFYLGGEATLNGLKLTVPLFLMMTLFNMFTNGGGLTVLFRIGEKNFTLESLLYGAANGMMLSAVVIWFRCFTAIVPNDRFLYLFGRRFQRTGLLLTMILKLFPETSYKIRCIKLADNTRCLGQKEQWIRRLKHGLKQMSCLLEWSMEDSIETVDSMKARGYGNGPRTDYQQYHFTCREAGILLGFVTLLLVSGAGVIWQEQNFWYFPTLRKEDFPLGITWGVNMAYIIFILMPVWMEIRIKKGENRCRLWK